MATPAQNARRMKREIRDWYRVHKFLVEKVEERANRPFPPPGTARREIVILYKELDFYNKLTQNGFQDLWRKLNLWGNSFPGVPDDLYPAPLDGPKIRLRRVMATNNLLTDTQRDNYVVVNETWKEDGGGSNKWERLIEICDALVDNTICLIERFNDWVDVWDAQGSAPREKQVQAILIEATEDLAALRNQVARTLIKARDKKNETEGTVPELRLRNRIAQRRNATLQGIWAINRGATTATGLPAGPEPDEFDPDVDTVRDEPPMGTDQGV